MQGCLGNGLGQNGNGDLNCNSSSDDWHWSEDWVSETSCKVQGADYKGFQCIPLSRDCHPEGRCRGRCVAA